MAISREREGKNNTVCSYNFFLMSLLMCILGLKGDPQNVRFKSQRFNDFVCFNELIKIYFKQGL